MIKELLHALLADLTNGGLIVPKLLGAVLLFLLIVLAVKSIVANTRRRDPEKNHSR